MYICVFLRKSGVMWINKYFGNFNILLSSLMFKIAADLAYVLHFFSLFLPMSPNHFSCLEMILRLVFVLFCCFLPLKSQYSLANRDYHIPVLHYPHNWQCYNSIFSKPPLSRILDKLKVRILNLFNLGSSFLSVTQILVIVWCFRIHFQLHVGFANSK